MKKGLFKICIEGTAPEEADMAKAADKARKAFMSLDGVTSAVMETRSGKFDLRSAKSYTAAPDPEAPAVSGTVAMRTHQKKN